MGTGPCILNHSSFKKGLIDGSDPKPVVSCCPVALTVVRMRILIWMSRLPLFFENSRQFGDQMQVWMKHGNSWHMPHWHTIFFSVFKLFAGINSVFPSASDGKQD